MRSVVQWLRDRFVLSRPWLILGKGPTFDYADEIDLSLYNTLSLNHACLPRPVSLAHFTDLDAALECVEVLRPRAESVVMPWYPHVKNKPGKLGLDILSKRHLGLLDLARQKRLLSYNSTLKRGGRPGLPLITVRYFSAVAAVNLLVDAGVRCIRTLGVDGGKSYAPRFSKKTLLANKRADFDIQFEEIQRTVRRHNVDFDSLRDLRHVENDDSGLAA